MVQAPGLDRCVDLAVRSCDLRDLLPRAVVRRRARRAVVARTLGTERSYNVSALAYDVCSRCTATAAMTSPTPRSSASVGIWASTRIPMTVAVAGSSATSSA